MDGGDTSSLEWLVWVGSALSLTGLGGLLYCIFRVSRARRSGLDDAQMRAVLKAVIPLNLGALALSSVGLMLVVLGVLLT